MSKHHQIPPFPIGHTTFTSIHFPSLRYGAQCLMHQGETLYLWALFTSYRFQYCPSLRTKILGGHHSSQTTSTKKKTTYRFRYDLLIPFEKHDDTWLVLVYRCLQCHVTRTTDRIEAASAMHMLYIVEFPNNFTAKRTFVCTLVGVGVPVHGIHSIYCATYKHRSAEIGAWAEPMSWNRLSYISTLKHIII